MKKRFFFYLLLGSMVLLHGCQKELSFEGGAGPSEGTLQDDGSGDCLPKTVVGTYVLGTPLVGSANYIEVQVNVTTPGSYTIYTDTANGISFRSSGVFTAAGLVTVKLTGSGTPLSAGIHNFVVTYGTSGCTISVTTSASLAAFTLDGAPGTCTAATPAGTYTVGTALSASNTVTINVDVTGLGAYSISTAVANGMTFTGSGAFVSLGSQAIILTGSGTPNTVGSTNVPITVGTSSCNFPVIVVAAAGPATYAVNCTSAVVNGTYTVGTPLAPSNTVSVEVNVATAGTYTITTTTTNGITFSATGTFPTAGTQTVTLNASGNPTLAGTNTIPVPSGTAACNFTINVLPGVAAATFTVNCASAVANGTYEAGTALGATNTITISLNVTVIGSYNITTVASNGMTFAGAGTVPALGNQTITLTGSGTPTNPGTFSIQVNSGATPCTFDVDVDPASLGTWTFKEGANTFSGTFSDAGFDNTSVPGLLIFYMVGETAAGHYFEIDLGDISAAIATGETYNCAASLPTQNPGIFYFEGPPPASTILYQATPDDLPNSLIITVTTHNVATKTITGTFAGNALDDSAVPVAKVITQGAFTITYP